MCTREIILSTIKWYKGAYDWRNQVLSIISPPPQHEFEYMSLNLWSELQAFETVGLSQHNYTHMRTIELSQHNCTHIGYLAN